MKKYITVAALLAAGTAFSNAITSVDSYTTSSLESGASSYIATVVFDGTKLALGYAGGSYANADVFFYFSGSYTTSGNSTPSDLDVGFYNGGSSNTTPSNATGFWSCLGSYTEGELSGWDSKNPNSGYLFNRGSGALLLQADTSKKIETVSVSYGVDVNASVSNTPPYTGTGIAVSVLYSDGSVETLASNIAYWLGTSSAGGYVCDWASYSVADLDCISSVSVVANSSALTTDMLAAASLAAIPEPSAFGLLAGVGALALVAARRRRTK